MSKIAYIKQREQVTEIDIEISREVDKVYKDREGETSVYKEMLRDVNAGDIVLLATVRDIGSYRRIFSLIKRLERKHAYIQSHEELWFSTIPGTTSRELLVGLMEVFKKK